MGSVNTIMQSGNIHRIARATYEQRTQERVANNKLTAAKLSLALPKPGRTQKPVRFNHRTSCAGLVVRPRAISSSTSASARSAAAPMSLASGWSGVGSQGT